MQQRLNEHRRVDEGHCDARLPLHAGRWLAEPAGSNVFFVVRHFGLLNVSGRFTRLGATIDIGRTLDDVRVHAGVDLSSIDTNNARRDDQLRGGQIFDLDTPTMVFHSTSVTGNGSSYRLVGDLTIATVTRAVSFDVEFDGTVCSVDRRVHAGFRAAGVIRRSDFGIGAGLGSSRLLIGDKVDIAIDTVFTACDADDRPYAA
jgi:polyisoprenoid-binding protein YceI